MSEMTGHRGRLNGRQVRLRDGTTGVICGVIHTDGGIDVLVEQRRRWWRRSWRRVELGQLRDAQTGHPLAPPTPRPAESGGRGAA